MPGTGEPQTDPNDKAPESDQESEEEAKGDAEMDDKKEPSDSASGDEVESTTAALVTRHWWRL